MKETANLQNDMKKVSAEDIKELRKLSKMSQRAFAEYFYISTRTVEEWEGGRRNCPYGSFDLMRYKLEKEGIITLQEN